MHFMPYENGKNQKNILQALFDDKNPVTGSGPMSSPWESEPACRIKLWKTLRELDTLPVFMPYLEEELFELLKRNSRIEAIKRVLQRLVFDSGVVIKDLEGK